MDEQRLDGPNEHLVNAYPGLVWPTLDSLDENRKIIIFPSSRREWMEAGIFASVIAAAALAAIAIVADLLM